MSRYRVDVITGMDQLYAFEPAWTALFQSDRRASPFQSPAWLLSWAECFAEKSSLRVVVLWSGARALLCLPLRLWQPEGQRRLGWLGEGLSDYLDVIAAPEAEPSALAVARDALRELGADAASVELTDLPAQSPLLPSPGPGWLTEAASVCPQLDAGGDASAYERALPSWLRRNLRQSQRRLESRGPLHWRTATPDSVSSLLDDFFALHGARWQAQGMPGALSDPYVQGFHRAAAARLVARGLLQLEVLDCGGRAVTAAYTLVRERAYLYLTGFDPSLAGVSLGSLVIDRAIRRSILARRTRIDFLRGREAYKYD
ncbi:MAG TPA: GNAT family N-acetyltransferase, partial [Polyangiaceae bacterium]|nr:GNAT family N-acetyltransferase [Polyangiaceae bacterium]